MIVVVMESFRDSEANSTTDSFSLYERYLRSFNVVNNFVEENRDIEAALPCEPESSSGGNIDLSINKHYEIPESVCNSSHTVEVIDKVTFNLDTDLCSKIEDTNLTSPSLLGEHSETTADHSHLTDKSDHTDVPVTSEDSKSSSFKQPVFITSTMENSNNAVDSVPLFRDTRLSENVFKLPIRELSFNGTLKHVQKLKPIVDPLTALTSNANLANLDDRSEERIENGIKHEQCLDSYSNNTVNFEKQVSDRTNSSEASSDGIRRSESTGDSQYEELNHKQQQVVPIDDGSKWNSEQSYSSFETSFDSGVRSPDMFSGDDDDDNGPVQEPFWSFLKDFQAHDKKRVRKLEETLQGILPPPSVTTLKIDVNEMLKKYYCFLPAFTEDVKVPSELNSSTPTKRVSFVEITTNSEGTGENSNKNETDNEIKTEDVKIEFPKVVKTELNASADKSIELKLCTEIEVKETAWPDLLKCRYYDVYYNLTHYSEKLELLMQKYGERFVGAETDSSVNVYSGGLQSPSSASKRKAMRLKMAQAKSPGRRLSHLARRRQTFCSAATIAEKASTSSKMVLIDKNFFPHRKLINSAERKSPRTRRTPGKKTPGRKTPGKKTPAKTPKSSSTKKKAMRRLLMDPEHVTRSQPREIKRALFISPENRKLPPPVPSTSVPAQAFKSRRALFGSPITADTKSMDGTLSDQFLKRKRDLLEDDSDNGRSKIAKSLSFGGDTIGTSSQPHSFSRRASEIFTTKSSTEWDETRKKKLLWAVSEALRVHGWRMSSPGFREKASSLARLTRRLLTLPPHAARLAAPKASTSETMLKIARQYVFAIIQGRTVDDCFAEEQMKIANETHSKVTGYISASAYQQLKARQATSTFTPFASQVKENYDASVKPEPPRSASKNILQDKLVNIDTNSNSSSSGLSMIDKVPLFKSNSMPSFEEAAKMRARRQISFDNVDFPKR